MGATLDIFGGAVRRLLGRGKNGRRPVSAPVARSLKYLVLAVILTAALCGVNLAFWASPIPLTTRLYALVLHPLGLEGIGQGLEAVSPLLERLGAVDWLYWHPDTRYFYTSCVIAHSGLPSACWRASGRVSGVATSARPGPCWGCFPGSHSGRGMFRQTALPAGAAPHSARWGF